VYIVVGVFFLIAARNTTICAVISWRTPLSLPSALLTLKLTRLLMSCGCAVH
jgi:hypothetical protein